MFSSAYYKYTGNDYEYFENPVIQPITLPMKYPLFGIEDLTELVECYGTCEINGKKL